MANSFKKQLLFNVIFLVAALAVLGGGFYWTTGKIDELTNKIGNQKILQFRYAHISEMLAQLKTTAPQADRYNQLMESLLPRNEQLVDFPIWLKGLATSHQLTSDFQFQGDPIAAAPPNPGYFNFTLNTGGTFENSAAFLNDLEKAIPRYLVSLEKYEVVRGGSAYQFALRGRIYFQ